MARNREKKGSLAFQIKNEFDKKLAIGQSKFEDKKIGATSNKIYSWNTYKAYLKHSNYFANFCKENYNIKDLSECKNFINEYIEFRKNQGLSNYTLKLEKSALVKLFNLSKVEQDQIKTDSRQRKNITRSRLTRIRDKHFSVERNAELIEFCKHTGLRRAELKALTGDKLFEKDGKYYIRVDVNSKGGRPRIVPVLNNNELVIKKMLESGENKVFKKIHNGADIHSYRSEYASQLYKNLRRKKIAKEDKYYCRKDKKGKVYDKQAMLEVSQALGHNRISVIAGHYLND